MAKSNQLLPKGFPSGPGVKNLHTNAEDTRDSAWTLGWQDPLEKEIATHSSILGWEIPWTEEPGVLQYIGYQRVGHNRATEHIQV